MVRRSCHYFVNSLQTQCTLRRYSCNHSGRAHRNNSRVGRNTVHIVGNSVIWTFHLSTMATISLCSSGSQGCTVTKTPLKQLSDIGQFLTKTVTGMDILQNLWYSDMLMTITQHIVRTSIFVQYCGPSWVHDWHICNIPFSSKLSREKTFTDR